MTHEQGEHDDQEADAKAFAAQWGDITRKELDALREKHGAIYRVTGMEEGETVIVRKLRGIEYTTHLVTMQTAEGKAALIENERVARKAIVHVKPVTVDELFDEYPGLGGRIALDLRKVGASEAPDRLKKYVPPSTES